MGYHTRRSRRAGRFSGGGPLRFSVYLPWGVFVEPLMASTVVVEVHPAGDTGFQLRQGAMAPQVDFLIFQAAPQPLDKHVGLCPESFANSFLALTIF